MADDLPIGEVAGDAPAEVFDPLEGGRFVLTDEGTLSREDFEARKAAGIEVEEVTEEEIAEEALKRQEADIFDAPVTTFLERAAGAATFSLTDYLRGTEGSYEAGQRVAYNPNSALAGEVTGAVVPGLLSGGSGTAATLARLTPAGRLSAMTGRIASRGGVRNALTSGAIEGMAGAAGDYASRVALDEDAEFSASGLLSAAAKGGVLGGALGGVADVASRGIGRTLAKRLKAEEAVDLGKLAAADDVLAPSGRILGKGKIGKGKAGQTSYKRIVRKEVADTNADAARLLERRIHERAGRSARAELTDLTESEAFQLVRQTSDVDGLVERAQKLSGQLDEAAATTRTRWSKYADEVELAKAKKTITRDADELTEDRLVGAIAETDELATEYGRVVDEIRARAGIPSATPATAVDPNLAALGTDLGSKGATAGLLQRIRGVLPGGEKLAALAGAAELAKSAGVDLGVPTPSDIPVVGALMGGYLKYKGARAAARGFGILPTSTATRAAEKVHSLRDRVGSAVKGFASKTARATRHVPSIRVVPAQVASRITDIQSVDPGQMAAEISTELEGTTPAVQQATLEHALRAMQYLQQTAPQDPVRARTSTMPPWQPSQADAMEYARREQAVVFPGRAAARVLEDALATIEVETLRAVHPAVFRTMQNDVLAAAPQIAETRGIDVLRRLGRQLQIPVSVDTAVPEYGTMTALDQPVEPSITFAEPSTPGASAAVRLETPQRLNRPG